jgi:uncharacterized protein (DUF1800 family)
MLYKYIFLIFTASTFTLATELSECLHLLDRSTFGSDNKQLQNCLSQNNYKKSVENHIYKRNTYQLDNFGYENTLIKPSRRFRELNTTELNTFRKERRKSYFALKIWWFTQLVKTEDPLLERMTLFWHNHFTSSLKKVGQASVMYQQNQLLRKYALGNFANLLHTIIEDPAMLIYLDNRSNKKKHPNENLARELLELFTLGEGHYSERDVKSLSRALTGYSVDKNFKFKFRKKQHDFSEKTFLYYKGKFDAHDIIDIILEQKETSLFIVKKLWYEFIGTKIDNKEWHRLARIFRDSHYEVKPLLYALFTSPFFNNSAEHGIMTKSPTELTAGTLRSFGYTDFDMKTGVQYTRRMGQDLFDPPNVKGWQGGENWINANTLLLRKAFLGKLLRGDAMKYMDFTLFDACGSKVNQVSCASKVLLPTNTFITSGKTVKHSLHTILQHPLYQLK